MSKCKELTKTLMGYPLNRDFLYPVKNVENYFDIIKHPMDFKTIDSKLHNGDYDSALEWYNDVCLIYDNAMLFNKPGTTLHILAMYNKKEFEKQAYGLGCADAQTWYDLTCKTMKKLNDKIANSPVPQAIDPLLLTISRKAETMPPPTSQSIAELVAKLNTKLSDTAFRLDIISLLKETHADVEIQGEKLTIDADSLPDITKNALMLYVKAH